MYRNNVKPVSDNDSSASEKSDVELSETDDEVFQPCAKRSKLNNGMVVDTSTDVSKESKVRRKKDIWSKVMTSQLQDETIKDLENTAVEGCRTKERGPESFTRPRFTKENKVSEDDGKLSASSIDNSIQKTMENIGIETSSANDVKQQQNQKNNNRQFRKAHRKNGERHKKLERFQNGKNNVIQFEYGVKRFLNKKNQVDENSTFAEVAQEIAFRLWERKRDLMLKMVTFLGVKKSLFLYTKVEQIEINGGMRTLQGDRRRTPGGLFIRMIELDGDVDQKAFQKLLEDDKTDEKKRNKERRKLARQRDYKNKNQNRNHHKNKKEASVDNNEPMNVVSCEAIIKADEIPKIQFVAAMEP